MVLYEVNLIVCRDILDAFLPWLKQHMQEMVALPGFLTAKLNQEFDLEQTASDSENHNVRLTALYTLESVADIHNYLQHHADNMRQQGVALFHNQFSASRRFFEVESEFDKVSESDCC